ncbi:hypothetical protein WR25_06670 [Diploscapter pachys]|uniref:LysR substrate-binding domain-containing protein n=1 Tax=Diploscapter pachys TaxID=2018661 RepID=A0A2A2K9M0_9BILA|nr:hypothetical protein WR25_06670 [Diploscapter pachys]
MIEQGVREVGGRSTTLQLKAPTCVMRWLLPRLLEWQALRPDVPVELTTTVRKLFDEQLTPVCAPSLSGAPLQLQDLARQMLLHPSRDEHDWRLWLQAANAGVEPQGPKQHFETRVPAHDINRDPTCPTVQTTQ